MNHSIACPCCKYLTLTSRGAFDLCPVCGWEDDGQDDADADTVRGGPNGLLSLESARRNFLTFGACEAAALGHVRAPWRAERPSQFDPEPAVVAERTRNELTAAILASDLERARAVLAVDASTIDAWDGLGMTPLLYAVYRADTEAVRLLLESGANAGLGHRDDPSSTPLWHAEEDFGLDEIAALLRSFGADA